MAPLTAAPATSPPLSPSFTSQSKISPTRAARIGQREFLAAFGHPLRGSLSRQQVHYWCHPLEFGQHDPVAIPVRSPSGAPTTPFGGFGLSIQRLLSHTGLNVSVAFTYFYSFQWVDLTIHNPSNLHATNYGLTQSLDKGARVPLRPRKSW